MASHNLAVAPVATQVPDNVIKLRRRGRGPANKGRKYPPNPILAEDIAVMLDAIKPSGPQQIHKLSAARLRALIAVLYRTGLRISEALDLVPSDLMPKDNAILVRHGKGDKRRVVVMDQWGWRELDRWMLLRGDLPDGYVFCVLRDNPGGRWASCDVRRQFHALQVKSGIAKRLAPHQLRHGHAVELRREGTDIFVIKEQFGHANLNVTSLYLKEVDPLAVLQPIASRKPPMVTIA